MQTSYQTCKEGRSFYLGSCYPGYWHQTYMATALTATVMKGSPTISHTTCFGCGQKGHWKRDYPEGKGDQGPKHVPPGGKPSKMCPRCNKAIIGLKTVNPNIMLI
jgi:hypothetical protein